MKRIRIGLRLNKKQRLIVVCGMFLLIVIISVIVVVQKNNISDSSTRRSISVICSDETIKKAVAYIEQMNAAELEAVVNDIKKNEGHVYDINCDYILARYYLMAGDVNNTSKYINEMKASVGAGAAYSTLLKLASDPVIILEESLSIIKRQQESKEGSVDGDLLNKVDEMENGGN